VSLVVDEHREYLADEARISAYRRALAETVKPGDVVLDLGAGTGVLGLLACRSGAARVYSVDEGSIIGLARDLCAANGFEDRMVFVKGLSTRIDIPEKVDVVVADQIGRFGFEAGVFDYFLDARARLLKPGGITVPSRIDLCVAPIESPELAAKVDFWSGEPAGFDFRPAREIAANTGYPSTLRPDQLLSDPATLASLESGAVEQGPWTFEAAVTATRPGTLHGIGGWFVAQLSESVSMSNGPLADPRINRRNVLFPVDSPVPIERGDTIGIRMRILPSQLIVAWTVEVCGSGGSGAVKARFTHSTLRGMLLAREDLERTRPGFVPTLSPWGEARLSILGLCDGKMSVSDIEREVFHRHPALFRSASEAAAFVAEVITRYSA
jgi:SAM-dependent methyltransferase